MTDSSATIFVSIACFMDPDVANTVADLFRKATNPERIFVGICLQYAPEYDAFDALAELSRVRIDRIPYTEAKGPIYARWRCEQLLRDEDFFLQIDCHTRFFQDWDSILLAEYARCQALSSNAVISHYPINIANMGAAEHLATIGHINRFRHVGADTIKMHGTRIAMPADPLPAFGLSAAMLFLPAAVKKAIPFDPNLHYGLHAAEQFLYSARLWTHGHDFFTPTRHTLATEYMTNRDRIPAPVRQHYNRGSAQWPEKTWTKVKYYLGLDSLIQVDESYREDVLANDWRLGLGKARHFSAYYRQIGLHDELLRYFPWYRDRYG